MAGWGETVLKFAVTLQAAQLFSQFKKIGTSIEHVDRRGTQLAIHLQKGFKGLDTHVLKTHKQVDSLARSLQAGGRATTALRQDVDKLGAQFKQGQTHIEQLQAHLKQLTSTMDMSQKQNKQWGQTLETSAKTLQTHLDRARAATERLYTATKREMELEERLAAARKKAGVAYTASGKLQIKGKFASQAQIPPQVIAAERALEKAQRSRMSMQDKAIRQSREFNTAMERSGDAVDRFARRMRAADYHSNRFRYNMANAFARANSGANMLINSLSTILLYGQQASQVFTQWGMDVTKMMGVSGWSSEQASTNLGVAQLLGIDPSVFRTAIRYSEKNVSTALSNFEKNKRRIDYANAKAEERMLAQRFNAKQSGEKSLMMLEAKQMSLERQNLNAYWTMRKQDTAQRVADQRLGLKLQGIANQQMSQKGYTARVTSEAGYQAYVAKQLQQDSRMQSIAESKRQALASYSLSQIQRQEQLDSTMAKLAQQAAQGQLSWDQAVRRSQMQAEKDAFKQASAARLAALAKEQQRYNYSPDVLALMDLGIIDASMSKETLPKPQEIIDKLIEIIPTIEPAKRMKVMQKFFGRGAEGMIRYFMVGANERERLAKEVGDAGMVLRKEDMKSWKSYYESLRIMQLRWQGIQIAVMRSLVPVIAALLPKVKPLLTLFQQHADLFVKLIGGMVAYVGLVKTAYGLWLGWRGIMKGIDIGGGILGAFSPGMAAKMKGGAGQAAGAVGAIKAALIAIPGPAKLAVVAVAALGAIGFTLYKKWKPFHNLVDSVLRSIGLMKQETVPAQFANVGQGKLEDLKKSQYWPEIQRKAEVQFGVVYVGEERYLQVLESLSGKDATAYANLQKQLKLKYNVDVTDPHQFIVAANGTPTFERLQKRIAQTLKYRLDVDDEQKFLPIARQVLKQHGQLLVTVKDQAGVARLTNAIEQANAVAKAQAAMNKSLTKLQQMAFGMAPEQALLQTEGWYAERTKRTVKATQTIRYATTLSPDMMKKVLPYLSQIADGNMSGIPEDLVWPLFNVMALIRQNRWDVLAKYFSPPGQESAFMAGAMQGQKQPLDSRRELEIQKAMQRQMAMADKMKQEVPKKTKEASDKAAENWSKGTRRMVDDTEWMTRRIIKSLQSLDGISITLGVEGLGTMRNTFRTKTKTTKSHADQPTSAEIARRKGGMATGGYVTSPTSALIGERGPEFVFNREQMAGLREMFGGLPKTQATSFKSVVKDALRELLVPGKGGGTGAMLFGSALQSYISIGATQRGLDPRAVLAVASVEGGFGGAIGDGGTSFGPFQLHIGGALPKGIRNPYAWSQSPEGVDYALNQIAGVASGLSRLSAISNIVHLFERPAAPDAEVAKAWGMYFNFGGGSGDIPRVGRQSASKAIQRLVNLARRGKTSRLVSASPQEYAVDDTITALLQTINLLGRVYPGMDKEKDDRVTNPKAMAGGGYVKGPTRALIGEKGPEFVFNREQMAGLRDMFGTVPRTMHVDIQGAGKELASTFVDLVKQKGFGASAIAFNNKAYTENRPYVHHVPSLPGGSHKDHVHVQWGAAPGGPQILKAGKLPGTGGYMDDWMAFKSASGWKEWYYSQIGYPVSDGHGGYMVSNIPFQNPPEGSVPEQFLPYTTYWPKGMTAADYYDYDLATGQPTMGSYVDPEVAYQYWGSIVRKTGGGKVKTHRYGKEPIQYYRSATGETGSKAVKELMFSTGAGTGMLVAGSGGGGGGGTYRPRKYNPFGSVYNPFAVGWPFGVYPVMHQPYYSPTGFTPAQLIRTRQPRQLGKANIQPQRPIDKYSAAIGHGMEWGASQAWKGYTDLAAAVQRGWAGIFGLTHAAGVAAFTDKSFDEAINLEPGLGYGDVNKYNQIRTVTESLTPQERERWYSKYAFQPFFDIIMDPANVAMGGGMSAYKYTSVAAIEQAEKSMVKNAIIESVASRPKVDPAYMIPDIFGSTKYWTPARGLGGLTFDQSFRITYERGLSDRAKRRAAKMLAVGGEWWTEAQRLGAGNYNPNIYVGKNNRVEMRDALGNLITDNLGRVMYGGGRMSRSTEAGYIHGGSGLRGIGTSPTAALRNRAEGAIVLNARGALMGRYGSARGGYQRTRAFVHEQGHWMDWRNPASRAAYEAGDVDSLAALAREGAAELREDAYMRAAYGANYARVGSRFEASTAAALGMAGSQTRNPLKRVLMKLYTPPGGWAPTNEARAGFTEMLGHLGYALPETAGVGEYRTIAERTADAIGTATARQADLYAAGGRRPYYVTPGGVASQRTFYANQRGFVGTSFDEMAGPPFEPSAWWNMGSPFVEWHPYGLPNRGGITWGADTLTKAGMKSRSKPGSWVPRKITGVNYLTPSEGPLPPARPLSEGPFYSGARTPDRRPFSERFADLLTPAPGRMLDERDMFGRPMAMSRRGRAKGLAGATREMVNGQELWKFDTRAHGLPPGLRLKGLINIPDNAYHTVARAAERGADLPKQLDLAKAKLLQAIYVGAPRQDHANIYKMAFGVGREGDGFVYIVQRGTKESNWKPSINTVHDWYSGRFSPEARAAFRKPRSIPWVTPDMAPSITKQELSYLSEVRGFSKPQEVFAYLEDYVNRLRDENSRPFRAILEKVNEQGHRPLGPPTTLEEAKAIYAGVRREWENFPGGLEQWNRLTTNEWSGLNNGASAWYGSNQMNINSDLAWQAGHTEGIRRTIASHLDSSDYTRSWLLGRRHATRIALGLKNVAHPKIPFSYRRQFVTPQTEIIDTVAHEAQHARSKMLDYPIMNDIYARFEKAAKGDSLQLRRWPSIYSMMNESEYLSDSFAAFANGELDLVDPRLVPIFNDFKNDRGHAWYGFGGERPHTRIDLGSQYVDDGMRGMSALDFVAARAGIHPRAGFPGVGVSMAKSERFASDKFLAAWQMLTSKGKLGRRTFGGFDVSLSRHGGQHVAIDFLAPKSPSRDVGEAMVALTKLADVHDVHLLSDIGRTGEVPRDSVRRWSDIGFRNINDHSAYSFEGSMERRAMPFMWREEDYPWIQPTMRTTMDIPLPRQLRRVPDMAKSERQRFKNILMVGGSREIPEDALRANTGFLSHIPVAMQQLGRVAESAEGRYLNLPFRSPHSSQLYLATHVADGVLPFSWETADPALIDRMAELAGGYDNLRMKFTNQGIGIPKRFGILPSDPLAAAVYHTRERLITVNPRVRWGRKGRNWTELSDRFAADTLLHEVGHAREAKTFRVFGEDLNLPYSVLGGEAVPNGREANEFMARTYARFLLGDRVGRPGMSAISHVLGLDALQMAGIQNGQEAVEYLMRYGFMSPKSPYLSTHAYPTGLARGLRRLGVERADWMRKYTPQEIFGDMAQSRRNRVYLPYPHAQTEVTGGAWGDPYNFRHWLWDDSRRFEYADERLGGRVRVVPGRRTISAHGWPLAPGERPDSFHFTTDYPAVLSSGALVPSAYRAKVAGLGALGSEHHISTTRSYSKALQFARDAIDLQRLASLPYMRERGALTTEQLRAMGQEARPELGSFAPDASRWINDQNPEAVDFINNLAREWGVDFDMRNLTGHYGKAWRYEDPFSYLSLLRMERQKQQGILDPFFTGNNDWANVDPSKFGVFRIPGSRIPSNALAVDIEGAAGAARHPMSLDELRIFSDLPVGEKDLMWAADMARSEKKSRVIIAKNSLVVPRNYKRNAEAAFGRATPHAYVEGVNWYARQGGDILRLAEELGIPGKSATDAAAVLSVSNQWTGNKNALFALMRAFAAGEPMPRVGRYPEANTPLAWSALHGTPIEDIFSPKALKTKDFSNALFEVPQGGGQNLVVVDRMVGRAVTGNKAFERPTTVEHYLQIAQAVRWAAERNSLAPINMQSVLWHVGSGRLGPMAKSSRGGKGYLDKFGLEGIRRLWEETPLGASLPRGFYNENIDFGRTLGISGWGDTLGHAYPMVWDDAEGKFIRTAENTPRNLDYYQREMRGAFKATLKTGDSGFGASNAATAKVLGDIMRQKGSMANLDIVQQALYESLNTGLQRRAQRVMHGLGMAESKKESGFTRMLRFLEMQVPGASAALRGSPWRKPSSTSYGSTVLDQLIIHGNYYRPHDNYVGGMGWKRELGDWGIAFAEDAETLNKARDTIWRGPTEYKVPLGPSIHQKEIGITDSANLDYVSDFLSREAVDILGLQVQARQQSIRSHMAAGRDPYWRSDLRNPKIGGQDIMANSRRGGWAQRWRALLDLQYGAPKAPFSNYTDELVRLMGDPRPGGGVMGNPRQIDNGLRRQRFLQNRNPALQRPFVAAFTHPAGVVESTSPVLNFMDDVQSNVSLDVLSEVVSKGVLYDLLSISHKKGMAEVERAGQGWMANSQKKNFWDRIRDSVNKSQNVAIGWPDRVENPSVWMGLPETYKDYVGMRDISEGLENIPASRFRADEPWAQVFRDDTFMPPPADSLLNRLMPPRGGEIDNPYERLTRVSRMVRPGGRPWNGGVVPGRFMGLDESVQTEVEDRIAWLAYGDSGWNPMAESAKSRNLARAKSLLGLDTLDEGLRLALFDALGREPNFPPRLEAVRMYPMGKSKGWSTSMNAHKGTIEEIFHNGRRQLFENKSRQMIGVNQDLWSRGRTGSELWGPQQARYATAQIAGASPAELRQIAASSVFSHEIGHLRYYDLAPDEQAFIDEAYGRWAHPWDIGTVTRETEPHRLAMEYWADAWRMLMQGNKLKGPKAWVPSEMKRTGVGSPEIFDFARSLRANLADQGRMAESNQFGIRTELPREYHKRTKYYKNNPLYLEHAPHQIHVADFFTMLEHATGGPRKAMHKGLGRVVHGIHDLLFGASGGGGGMARSTRGGFSSEDEEWLSSIGIGKPHTSADIRTQVDAELYRAGLDPRTKQQRVTDKALLAAIFGGPAALAAGGIYMYNRSGGEEGAERRRKSLWNNVGGFFGGIWDHLSGAANRTEGPPSSSNWGPPHWGEDESWRMRGNEKLYLSYGLRDSYSQGFHVPSDQKDFWGWPTVELNTPEQIAHAKSGAYDGPFGWDADKYTNAQRAQYYLNQMDPYWHDIALWGEKKYKVGWWEVPEFMALWNRTIGRIPNEDPYSQFPPRELLRKGRFPGTGALVVDSAGTQIYRPPRSPYQRMQRTQMSYLLKMAQQQFGRDAVKKLGTMSTPEQLKMSIRDLMLEEGRIKQKVARLGKPVNPILQAHRRHGSPELTPLQYEILKAQKNVPLLEQMGFTNIGGPDWDHAWNINLTANAAQMLPPSLKAVIADKGYDLTKHKISEGSTWNPFVKLGTSDWAGGLTTTSGHMISTVGLAPYVMAHEAGHSLDFSGRFGGYNALYSPGVKKYLNNYHQYGRAYNPNARKAMSNLMGDPYYTQNPYELWAESVAFYANAGNSPDDMMRWASLPDGLRKYVQGVVGPTWWNTGPSGGGKRPSWDYRQYAGGGVITKPTLALMGEGGRRETVFNEAQMKELGKWMSGGGGRVEVHVHMNGVLAQNETAIYHIARQAGDQVGREVDMRLRNGISGYSSSVE